MKKNKITVVGAGFVGSTAAHWAASRELGDVVLIDINEGAAKGKALDLFEASPVEHFDSRVIGTSDYADTANSDVVILTAGMPRKPGMSRDELLAVNSKIVKDCTEGIAKYSPNCHLIVVSNPLDAMAYVAKKVSGFPRQRITGMAGVLDTARFRAFIAEALDVSVKDIQAVVLGGHGDTMVPLARHASVSGIPLTELMSKEKLDKLIERTRNGGAEIVNLLKTGSAFYAPSASAVQMAECILKDQKRILPAAVYLEGEYGVKGLFIGVMAKFGAGGMEKVIEVKLNDEEKAGLQKSIAAVQDLVNALKL
jgi:malate dehydrogenase